MIHRQCARRRGKGRAALPRELFGMELDRQVQRLRHGKDAPDLRGVKGDIFAKPVHGIDKPLLMCRNQCRDRDAVDIGVRPVLVFCRDRMGAEKAGSDPDGAMGGNLSGDPQHAHFGLGIKPIAGFDLDRGHPFGQKSIHSAERIGQKRFFICIPGRRDRRHDAAACARDLGITCAGQPHFEFPRPVAAENQMGVTVNQPGGHQSTVHIASVLLFGGGGDNAGRGVRFAAGPDDPIAVNQDGRRVNRIIPIGAGHRHKADIVEIHAISP